MSAEYDQYLQSWAWRFTKWLRKESKCAKCDNHHLLQLHHKRYNWHNAHPILRYYLPNMVDPMETLCQYHHWKEHGK